MPQASADYDAARHGVAVFDGGDRGWIEMEGPDAAGFLQRLLSSDVNQLRDGGGQWSALLDGKGHWIADLLLFRFEGRFGLDLPAQRVEKVLQMLQLFHFGEKLAWQGGDAARLLALGPRAAPALADAGLAVPGTEQDEFAVGRSGELLVLRRPDRGAACVELLGPVDAVKERLLAGGAVAGSARTLEALRIEAFQPRFGADFDEESTLPESGEWRRASLTKGCYAGQEVVARVNTYGEAPWQLCRLELEAEAPGAELADEAGKAAGRVTSSSGRAGLGRLRRRYALEGKRLWAAHAGARVPVIVHPRPRRLG